MPLANNHNKEAQHNLGLMYEDANGVTGSFQLARIWYTKAAPYHVEAKKQLDALASYSLAPPAPDPERGWFEKVVIQAYKNSQQAPRTSNSTQGSSYVYHPWRCYNLGNGYEQCFNN